MVFATIQSFADLWVDFLLKETEERERRELAQSAEASGTALERSASAMTTPSAPASDLRVGASGSRRHSDANTTSSTPYVRGNQQSEHLDSEFSTVSLASSGSLLPENSSKFSRMLPRY